MYDNDDIALSHELGHALSESVKSKISNDLYPSITGYASAYHYIYPHFRESKSYKRNMKTYGSDYAKDERSYYFNKDKAYAMHYTGVPYNSSHDGDPSESYSDLIALRYALHKLGLYDSTKANNPFTKEILEKFKKKLKVKNNYVINRLFLNYTDD
jgi:hypothetical protein